MPLPHSGPQNGCGTEPTTKQPPRARSEAFRRVPRIAAGVDARRRSHRHPTEFGGAFPPVDWLCQCLRRRTHGRHRLLVSGSCRTMQGASLAQASLASAHRPGNNDGCSMAIPPPGPPSWHADMGWQMLPRMASVRASPTFTGRVCRRALHHEFDARPRVAIEMIGQHRAIGTETDGPDIRFRAREKFEGNSVARE